jgi:hypothetical protein
MPQLLTTNAIITCLHGGPGTTTPSIPKWQINGGFVCVEQDVGVLACPFLVMPCGGYKLQSMGLNATKIDESKAILVTDFNQSFTGLPLLMTETHAVIDQSTPAPIPAGQQAPAQSPALTDLLAPIVVVAPPSFPFKITPPPAPLPVVFTFSLTTNHPLQWILTLITVPSAPTGQHFDLTNGIPGSVTVSPAGGQWTSPSLTVTVTMTPPFVSSLGPGTHQLYLTGVSQRGISGHAMATIPVTP